MKKLILFLIFIVILPNTTYVQTSPNIILGEIIETEGEYVFIDIDKDKEVVLGMIFGIYNSKNEAIGVCEINKIIKKGNYISCILTQSDEIKKGYMALADIEREYKLREKIKELKASTYYLDSYKKFEDFVNKPVDMVNSDIPAIKDKILRKIFCQSMQYLGIQISKFSNPFLKDGEIIPLNFYRDILNESSKLKIDALNNRVNIETIINIGRLKRQLQNKGYSFKPKIVRLVFPNENDSEVIKQVIDKMLISSNYISKETEEFRDITSPISCVIYTTPKIFADEINTFDFEDIGISAEKIYQDTIELKIW